MRTATGGAAGGTTGCSSLTSVLASMVGDNEGVPSCPKSACGVEVGDGKFCAAESGVATFAIGGSGGCQAGDGFSTVADPSGVPGNQVSVAVCLGCPTLVHVLTAMGTVEVGAPGGPEEPDAEPVSGIGGGGGIPCLSKSSQNLI